TQDFVSGACGTSPITASITKSQAPGARPMDPWTLTAVPVSNDSDPNFCPARFAPSYTFAWSANASTPPATFNTDTSNPTTFTPGTNQLYTAHVVVSGNGQSGSADEPVDASCRAPPPAAPTAPPANR